MTPKLLMTVFILLCANISFSQNPTFSTLKLGNLKIGSPLDSVNTYLDSKIKFSKFNPSNDYSGYDTVNTMYKKMPVRLVFYRFYEYDTATGKLTNKLITNLQSIYSSSKLFKTKSGIQIGDNKFDIIKKLDGSSLSINLDYRYPGNKKYSCVHLFDGEIFNTLTFYFLENILYAFEVSVSEEGD